LASPANARQMIDVVEHFRTPFKPIIPWHVGGIDMSINMMVITLWVVVVAVMVFILVAGRRPKLIPGPLQSVAESAVLFIRNGIVMEMMGKEGLPWIPFLTTLFLFILFNNLLGMIPGLALPTSSIYVTMTLALMVFLATHITGVVKHGPIKYFKALTIPSGVPLWLTPLMIPIELVSNLIAKPISLMVRLFANMFAGHTVLLVFFALIIFYNSLAIATLPLALSVVISILEILFKVLQAYIFTILSAMYIGDAIHGGH
jgi:F-type H+-transporting ATPase subunit a